MFIIVYVTARSWEPWCEERVTSPFAVGSLDVKSFLRYRSLVYVASLGLLGGPFGALLVSFWGPFGPFRAVLGPFGAVWGRLGCHWPSWGSLGGLLGPSWEPLGALLGLSWGRLGTLSGRLGALWGRLGALLGRFRALLGASGTVLGRSLEPLGPFLARNGENHKNHQKPKENL